MGYGETTQLGIDYVSGRQIDSLRSERIRGIQDHGGEELSLSDFSRVPRRSKDTLSGRRIGVGQGMETHN